VIANINNFEPPAVLIERFTEESRVPPDSPSMNPASGERATRLVVESPLLSFMAGEWHMRTLTPAPAPGEQKD
jgi:hypothetical protein